MWWRLLNVFLESLWIRSIFVSAVGGLLCLPWHTNRGCNNKYRAFSNPSSVSVFSGNLNMKPGVTFYRNDIVLYLFIVCGTRFESWQLKNKSEIFKICKTVQLLKCVVWNAIHAYVLLWWCISLTLIGIVGEVDDGGDGFYIWTHKKFDIGYNGNQIVDVNLTSEAKVKLAPNTKISLTYEVWIYGAD